MTPAALLPPIPQPPHDPTFTLLGPARGWRSLDLRQVSIDAFTSALMLGPAPGTARSLTEPSGSLGGLVPPANVAVNPACDVWLADPVSRCIKRFDPCACRFNVVPCQHGRIGQPRAIAVWRNRLFAVDGSSKSVKVLSLPELAPRGEWEPPENPWDPSGIAIDPAGQVWVSDLANGSVHRFSGSGHWQGSTGGFGVPRHLASDCEGLIYVVSDNGVVIASTGQPVASPSQLRGRFPELPFDVDRDGNLHFRVSCIGIFNLSGDPITPAAAPPAEQYVHDGTLIAGPLDSRIYKCQWHRVILHGTVPRAASVRVSTYTSEAVLPDELVTLPGLPWRLHPASVPQTNGDWDCLIQSPPGRYLWLKLDLAGNGFVTPRIAGVRIEFPRISLRRYLPAVFGEDPVSADFVDRFLSVFDTSLRSIESSIDQGASYYDPRSTPAAVDPKTGIDFLSWLASWIGVRLDRQLPEARRREILAEAGKALALRGTRTGLGKQLLQFIGWERAAASCPADCALKGRCPGRTRCPADPCRRCAQPPTLILEHFQIRRWLFAGAGRLGGCSELWGRRIVNRSQLNEGAQVGATQLVTSNDPLRDPFHYTAHKFTVFMPGRIEKSETLRRSLLNLLRSETPAHTQYNVEFVGPRFRIGFQSSIGLNSVVGRYPEGVTLDATRIGSDSVLSGSRRRSLPAQVGRTTLHGS